MTVAEIARVLEAGLDGVTDPEALVTGPPAVDSREVVTGGLFAATAGANVDGHDYAAKAVASGAVAVLATRPVGVPAIVVEDVQRALGVLAAHVLARLDCTVVALTGSVGKTTTKDMLAQVLEQRAPTISTDRSFNNELGLPLTVLRADGDTRYLVLEMGAGTKGDLTYLTGIAPPQVSLVLNVGTAHVSRMGGGKADVAAAKGELVEALTPDGYALLNADDPYVLAMAERTRGHVVLYGRSPEASVRAEDVSLGDGARPSFDLVTPTGRARIALDLIGEHQVANALGAAAAATALGLPIEEVAAGLNAARRRSSGRFEITERADGVTVINDAYNANPESMRAGLTAFRALAGDRRAVAVLGGMGQQGDASLAKHEQIGRLVADLGIQVLIVVGDGDQRAIAREASGTEVAVHTVEDVTEAVKVATELIAPGDVVFVKASSEYGLGVCARELAAL
ncbi:UDP-N-acetylmuramoyl-tripeptide--D-alanyl-D-alanine ligase [Umezawaea endophytica]|uniref:UDP-N-acetylmuramoyl-tripeptide--D-alanyl-D-alanine ligase n=1 Tax=Umezawaea endophytica TaxID=1654476 RepID=A0A9X2VJL5_9PSEU|nr:UDP-N-acetylmuramoyl-tripeptide--D-alanyl-D-alanine ligase [Umezawaea endophytica]MCS7477816.1 UDP-N-acetylmuramoyl-tripeptide--D-alanyl-D-alanine ligase [Umezawaea endophytica]